MTSRTYQLRRLLVVLRVTKRDFVVTMTEKKRSISYLLDRYDNHRGVNRALKIVFKRD